MTLGEELRAIRQKLGMSLQAVEDKSDGRFKTEVVGSWERGDRRARVESIRALLAFYGGYRLEVLRPGDVVHHVTDPGGAEVLYVVDIGCTRVECENEDEARKVAERVPGARVGTRLIGPVIFADDGPVAIPAHVEGWAIDGRAK